MTDNNDHGPDDARRPESNTENTNASRETLPEQPRFLLTGDYDVGYGKPPVQTRFPPGQSGNPRGRPKGAKTRTLFERPGNVITNLILQEGAREYSITENGQMTKIAALQVIVRKLHNDAMKGDKKAAGMLLKAYHWIESVQREEYRISAQNVAEYKAFWEPKLEEVENNPYSPWAKRIPLPHPDHVELDVLSGSILLTGPANEKEKQDIDDAWKQREVYLHDLAAAKMLESSLDPQIKRSAGEIRLNFEKKIAELDALLGIASETPMVDPEK